MTHVPRKLSFGQAPAALITLRAYPMKTSLELIVSKLDQALTIEINQEDTSHRYAVAIKLIETATAEFQAVVSQRKLTEQEEIDIFKNLKPAIDAYRIEEGLRYNFLNNLPVGTNTEKTNYWQEELKGLQALFRHHPFYYQYYKNGFDDLDHLYFSRSQVHPQLPVPEIPESVHEFYHPISYLFAQFKAYERLQLFVLDRLSRLHLNESAPTASLTHHVMFKWTGEAVNLVELAYGLWLTGQINHGNASLNQIVRWLEGNLEVKMGNVQKRFMEIERRKRISTTRYLDQMTQAVRARLETGSQ
jgi:hypothetical protein